jgi:uncharacterized protein YneF (UPF0154 family)
MIHVLIIAGAIVVVLLIFWFAARYAKKQIKNGGLPPHGSGTI